MNDGGPAFPTGQIMSGSVNGVNQVGMSLRDWFAGQALASLCNPAHRLVDQEGVETPYEWKERAEDAYRIADAMIEARGKKL